ncbi:hypothetical protein M8J76_009898 [Diaphorina citri]|nr:hypothetical protein M8J75_001306 [Diaphorina citri]KAI5730091.1 hypothetical protein M8J76_009898 [Diaphorina citri]KAI5735278.1 hypothetical protein M8J77_016549 [Diaphorina citri]
MPLDKKPSDENETSDLQKEIIDKVEMNNTICNDDGNCNDTVVQLITNIERDIENVKQHGNVDLDVDTNVRRDVETNVRRDVETNVRQDVNKKVELNINMENARQDIKRNIEQGVDSSVEVMEVDLNRNVEQDIKRHMERGIDINVEQDMKRKMERGIKRIHRNVEHDIKRNVEQDVNEKVKKDINKNKEQDIIKDVEMDLKRNTKRNIDTNVELDTDTNVDLDIDTEYDEMDLEFPSYLEELKSDIVKKVMAMSSLKTIVRRDSLDNEHICRICYDDSNDHHTPPTTMCRCRGSVGLVHLHCLEKWLNEKTTDTCELCQYKFQTRFEPTERNIGWSMLKFVWLRDKTRGFPAPNCLLFVTQVILLTILLTCFNLFAISFTDLLAAQSQADPFYTRYTSNLCVLLLVLVINWLFTSLLIRDTWTQYWIWYHWWLKTFSVKLILDQNIEETGKESR